MNPNRRITLLVIALLTLGGLSACEKKKEPEAISIIPPRNDFSREEFGIGRKHTKNAGCNREIDQLLDQIRICINTRTTEECASLQDGNNGRIGQLKNQLRCAR